MVLKLEFLGHEAPENGSVDSHLGWRIWFVVSFHKKQSAPLFLFVCSYGNYMKKRLIGRNTFLLHLPNI